MYKKKERQREIENENYKQFHLLFSDQNVLKIGLNGQCVALSEFGLLSHRQHWLINYLKFCAQHFPSSLLDLETS